MKNNRGLTLKEVIERLREALEHAGRTLGRGNPQPVPIPVPTRQPRRR